MNTRWIFYRETFLSSCVPITFIRRRRWNR
uniref:Uncharacterized protein n=1 Tax=Siphoviridae sp. ct3z32 TaxID=2825327 RepID=A0A8S5VHS9_9CAUD|nr:MAG TPA: hypothetical protein [Siphoviridae sp. ct3z32]